MASIFIPFITSCSFNNQSEFTFLRKRQLMIGDSLPTLPEDSFPLSHQIKRVINFQLFPDYFEKNSEQQYYSVNQSPQIK